ncbi:hypothetical protein [Pararcticibacter amylolyticus]|uniref:Uncharacterized protein n=1 Tax=Pararcticibacter amylolyticus TaxID=2173175 RepID=A0A2U2PN37_9SPHI|nr:hypothetical protein [Pararcticibacter amylolyticus]PWG82599.1 hypothetical protein DDR33_01690 [Pararcticibacter amylolyticus]
MHNTEIGIFILNAPLFKKYEVSAFDGDIIDILFFNGAIDCFCPKCGTHSIFQGQNDDPNRRQHKINLSLGFDAPNATKKERKLTGVYILDFYCSRDRDHKLHFILKVDDQKMIKIGQSPSPLEIMQNDFKQYKQLLGASFSDLNSAVILYSNNFGVASFTHLRRIIENFFMVEAFKAYESQKGTYSGTPYNELRFKDKFNLVRDYLPETFTENPKLYSIASSGIHSLTEEKCREYFIPLKDCIILCLDEMLADIKKRAMKANVKESLGKIASSIGKNQS